MPTRLSIQTRHHDDWQDITTPVRDAVTQARFEQGVVHLFVPHTTAGLTIQENADPPLRMDITRAFERLFPWVGDYGHCEDNAAAHMKTALVGSATQVPVEHGKLLLGTWQAIYLCEFDGPRQRDVILTFVHGE
jgi:secondary thiamine-phosphate synthase enzyme